MKNSFRKRVFTPASLLSSIAAITGDIPRLPRLLYADAITPAFREKLFLAVTSVNKCRYCTWAHTAIAAGEGVAQADIAALIGGGAELITGDEAEAVAYAVHFAETERNPSPEQTQKLLKKYGEDRARQILQYLNLIYFANLSGNTFDAFLSRAQGTGDSGGNAIFETIFALLAAPPLLAVRAAYGKDDNEAAA